MFALALTAKLLGQLPENILAFTGALGALGRLHRVADLPAKLLHGALTGKTCIIVPHANFEEAKAFMLVDPAFRTRTVRLFPVKYFAQLVDIVFNYPSVINGEEVRSVGMMDPHFPDHGRQ